MQPNQDASDARIEAIKDGVDLPLAVTKRRFS